MHHLSESLKESLCIFCGKEMFKIMLLQELVLHAAVMDVYLESRTVCVNARFRALSLSYLSARCGEHFHGLSAPVCAGCDAQLSV